MLRARDVMRKDHPCANHNDSLRAVGVAMAKANVDLIPIVDDDGVIVGILTARDLARRYIKESGEPSSFADRPASADLIVEVLGGDAAGGAPAAPHRAALGGDGGRREHGQHDGPQRHRRDRQPPRRAAPRGGAGRGAGGVAVRRPARRRRDRGGARERHGRGALPPRLLRHRAPGLAVGAGARGDEPQPAGRRARRPAGRHRRPDQGRALQRRDHDRRARRARWAS